MNKKIEEYQIKANKIVRTVKLIGITVFLLGIIMSIIWYTINKTKNDLKNARNAEIIKEDDYENSGNGVTYYVSMNGISDEGTDINNPMSLDVANQKKYNGNDKVLFKCGDIFHGLIDFDVSSMENALFYIGCYGTGEKPIISGANVIKDRTLWDVEDGLYKIDLSNFNNITTIKNPNIGFFTDENENIYGNRKKSKDKLVNENDFCCENSFLYLKCNENPTDKFGTIKFACGLYLVKIASNTIIENLNIQYTGSHAISKKNDIIENVIIKNCIIQNIGGSVQIEEPFTRFGNGIEFWNQAENTVVKNCIFRNIYDAAYTLQGNQMTSELGFYNNFCKENIFINCTYDIEIFCRNKSDNTAIRSMVNYQIYDNISINEGRGWGYDVRPYKYSTAAFVLWSFQKMNTGVEIFNNKYFNPRRLNYIHKDLSAEAIKYSIKSNKNTIYLNKDTYIINDSNSLDILKTYNINTDSIFNTIIDDELNVINNKNLLETNDYKKIKTYYEFLDGAEYKAKTDLGSIKGYKYTKNNREVVLVYSENEDTKIPYTDYIATDLFGNVIENIKTLTISKEPIFIFNYNEEISYSQIAVDLANLINDYVQKYNIYFNRSSTMKNVLAALENIKTQANILKTSPMPVKIADVTNLIENTYFQGQNIIKAFESKEFESNYEDMCNMLIDLYSITNSIQKYYNSSIGDATNFDKSAEITQNLRNFENVYQYYKNDDIGYILRIATMAKQNIDDKTNENKNINIFKMLSAYYLSNYADKMINIYSNDLNSGIIVNIQYSNIAATNQSVVAKLVSNAELEVTNNANSKEYTFTENGTFTFKYKIKGKEFTKTAEVNNIDKILPRILGVQNDRLYLNDVTPIIQDANLQSVTLYKNQELINGYKSGDIISEDGNYKLIAKDFAGNETEAQFYISRDVAKIQYSTTDLTNKDVTATIVSNFDVQVNNNSNSKVRTFTENGDFVFDVTIKGVNLQFTAIVNNIDKIPPKVEGVENQKAYSKEVIPIIEDENLSEIILTKDQEKVEGYASNKVINESGEYELIAKDLAGNETKVSFKIESNIITSDKLKIDETDLKVSGIEIGETVETLKQKIQSEMAYRVTDKNGDTLQEQDKLGTGYKIIMGDGKEYEIAVLGDINGDTKITAVDVARLLKIILNIKTANNLEKLAADFNQDKAFNIIDVAKLQKLATEQSE